MAQQSYPIGHQWAVEFESGSIQFAAARMRPPRHSFATEALIQAEEFSLPFSGAGSYDIEHPLMDSTEHVTRRENPAEPGALLAAYLDSGRKESAFVALVDRLGGLVFASALRRTGVRVLAEEVSQNVFAILARKAGSLRSHPNLSAWVFRTTQLESIKAMRAEQRHTKKIAAFGHDAVHQPDAEGGNADASWQDALPALDTALDELPERDRSLLIERFFEKKRFAEIARGAGKSEAACKMQVKRSLEKLAAMLRSKGVALSVPAVAAGLSIEFAKASEIAAPTLATKALAASASIPVTTLFSNTILTMSSAKTSAIAAAAVVALSLIPIVHQEGRAANLRAEISSLESHPPLAAAGTVSASIAPAASSGASGQRLGELLAASRGPVDLNDLLEDVQKVMMEQDMAGAIRVLTPVATMEPGEYSQLMAELDAYQGNPQLKMMASQVFGMFAPEANFRESLENMIRQGANPGAWRGPLRRWAEADPDAALAWFEGARAAGDLLGKGVHSDPAPALFAEILAGMAITQPDRALELALAMPADERARSRVDATLATAFARESVESGDTRHLDRLLNDTADPGSRYNLINEAANAIGGTGELDAARSFLARSMPDDGSDVIDARMLDILSEADRVPFGARADWIVTHTDPEDAADRLRYIITNELGLGDAVAGWVRSQPAGSVRDEAQAAYAKVTAIRTGHRAGLEAAEQIADPDLKSVTRRAIADSWLKMSPDAARKELPADLLPAETR